MKSYYLELTDKELVALSLRLARPMNEIDHLSDAANQVQKLLQNDSLPAAAKQQLAYVQEEINGKMRTQLNELHAIFSQITNENS
jgi:hypothetical protein